MNVESAGRSVEVVNDVLQMINSKSIDFAKKMVKTNAEMTLSASLPGIGEMIDVKG